MCRGPVDSSAGRYTECEARRAIHSERLAPSRREVKRMTGEQECSGRNAVVKGERRSCVGNYSPWTRAHSRCRVAALGGGGQ